MRPLARHAHWLVAFLFYSSVVAFLHAGILRNLGSRILAGNQVGSVLVWECWWLRLCVFHPGHLNYLFTNLLMYPAGVPVFMHSPLAMAFYLLLNGFADPYVTYSLFCLAAYVGAGLSMYGLARYVTSDGLAAFLGGYFFMFSHDGLTQHFLGQVGQANVFFVPLTVMGLLKLTEQANVKNWGIFAVGCVGASLTTPYVAFSTLAVLVPLLVITNRTASAAERKFFLRGVGLVYAIVFLVGLIFYGPMIRYGNELIGGSESSSLSLLSFFDFPAWHPSPLIQRLRHWTSGMKDAGMLDSSFYLANPNVAFLAKPENLMGFFGFTTLGLLFAGILRGSFKGKRVWFFLCLAGVIFALGPYLEISYRRTHLPLPYVIFTKLPLLKTFRTPSRMIGLTWVGISVLSAIAFKDLTSHWSRPLFRFLLLAVLLLSFSWEMGLTGIGKNYTQLVMGPCYRVLKGDPSNTAVLELPVSINKQGDISINAQSFMLYQPLHSKPLVLGRPPRHSWASLAFCESTDFVYELTHPVTLRKLYTDVALAPRLEQIKKGGREILHQNGIRYVLLHKEDGFFSEEIMEWYKRMLGDVLGRPFVEDEYGRSLYKVF